MRSMIALAAFLIAGSAVAQDPVAVNAKTIQLRTDENELVRVLEARLPPGAKEELHSHPAYVTYVVSGGKAINHTPDGKVSPMELKTGDVIYRDATTHWAENTGTTEIHLILVELKEAIAGAAAARTGQTATAPDAVKLSPRYYSVRLDNERVRVVEFVLKPGQKEPMHSHLVGVAYVTSSAKVRTTFPNGAAVDGTLGAGEVYLRKENVVHTVENIGKTELRSLIVELKEPKR